MKTPQLFTAEQIKAWDSTRAVRIPRVTSSSDDVRWAMARPESACTFLDRVKLAWVVLIGKYDALHWHGQ